MSRRWATPAAGGLRTRRRILQSLPVVGLWAAAGCTVEAVRESLPPVTPPPVQVVRAESFTPTPSPPAPTPTVTAPPRAPLRTDSTVAFTAWGSKSEMRALTEALAFFQRAEPGVEVAARLDNAITPDATRSALRGPTPLGVTRVAPEDVFDFTSGGLLLPLDSFVERDIDAAELAPQALEARRGPGGEVGALSLGAAYLTVFYNEAHLEASGVAPPTGWDDSWDIAAFEEAARRLVVSDAERTDRFGLAYVPWAVRAWLASATGGDAAGRFFSGDERRSTMLTSTHSAALRRLTGWQVESEFELAIAERFAGPFNGGLVSLYVDASNFAPIVRPAVRWGIAPLPTWSRSDPLTAGLELCLAIDARTPEPEAAWRLASFFLGPEAQRALARHDAVVPFRREVLRDPAFLDPNRQPLDRSVWVSAADRALQSPANPGAKAWHQVTDTPVNAVRDGSVDAETYLAGADSLITRQLRARSWSAAKSQPGYRQVLPLGNELLAEPTPDET